MALVFKQLAGTAASAVDACNASDHDVAATASKWGAQVDGSTANTQYTLTVPGVDTGSDSVVLLAQWETTGPEYGSPGETTTWEAGNWICRVNVSQANSNVFWDSVEICAYKDGSTTAIASKTGIATNLSSTGTLSETITTGSPSTVPAGATILWSFYFGQTISTGRGNTFKIRSNKNLATPIANKRGVAATTFASASLPPGTTMGAISVAAPTATFASAAIAPELEREYVSPTWRGVISQGAPVAAAPVAEGAVQRGSVSHSAVAAGATNSGSFERGNAVSGGVLASTAESGSAHRGVVGTAALEASAVPEGYCVNAVVGQGSVESVSISEAMTVRGVLVGGGPEALSIG
tara:strand:+ start:947 stop:1999 length:1053 start_codon:yes stop_codon:yes gene_type:complete